MRLSRHTILLLVLACPGVSLAQGPPIRDPQHRVSKRVTSWMEIKEQNVVMQEQDYSCGAAALATVARHYWGDPVGENRFLFEIVRMLTPAEMAERVENGLSMSDLRRAAVGAGYQAIVGRLSFTQLTQSRVPLIVGITVDDYDHFVVYRGEDGRYVYLADPIRGNIRIPIRDFLDQWQENAALVIAKPGAAVRSVSPLTVTQDEIDLGELNTQLIRRQLLPSASRPRPQP